MIDRVAVDSQKFVSLMSTDCERIARGLKDVHELWANVLQIGLATWLIEREIAVACTGPVGVAFRS
jgi:ATP-binding cassette, subfamily C (CFTR/MRP), member 1